jgi:hypothetical protein
MRPLTIQVDDKQLTSLEAMARDFGAPSIEGFLSAQIEQLINFYRTKGMDADMKEHLKASIQENRRLLERLAQ